MSYPTAWKSKKAKKKAKKNVQTSKLYQNMAFHTRKDLNKKMPWEKVYILSKDVRTEKILNQPKKIGLKMAHPKWGN